MPNTQSAKKELRKTKVRTDRNSLLKKNIKDTLKRITKALSTDKIEDAQKAALEAAKLLDKAAKRNIIHKNKASRKKSRIQKTIQSKLKK